MSRVAEVPLDSYSPSFWGETGLKSIGTRKDRLLGQLWPLHWSWGQANSVLLLVCPGSYSLGLVCTVLPATPFPLCPAAVPEAGGPAGPQEPGATEEHRGTGRACDHLAL